MIKSGAALRLAASMMALCVASGAAAQQAGPREGGAAPDSASTAAQRGDEQDQPTEIVVTARKVAERLSDAPVSVSVVGADQIAERGLTSIDDFAKNATGISFSQAFGRSGDRPVIRGQSNVLAGVQFGVETGAAYFVDGIYYQGDIQGFDPLSIERVEIIKGPQSALYGRNTYAGAINYITKDPGREMSFGGRVRGAQHGEREIAVSASGPILGDLLGFRVGGRLYRYDGEYKNLLTGRRMGDESTDSVYATLVFKPAPGLKIRTRGELREDRDGPPAYFLWGSDLLNCKPGFRSNFYRQPSSVQPLVGDISAGQNLNKNQYYCGAIEALPNRVRSNTDPVATVGGFGVRDGTAYDGLQNKQKFVSNIIDWDIAESGWTVSSLTGWRKNRNRFGTDSDFTEAFFFLFPSPDNALPTTEPAFANTTTKWQRDVSQEFRLSSPQDKRIRGLVGAYYFDQKITGSDLTFIYPSQGVPIGGSGTSIATIRNKAVFALLAADILENLTVTGEIRRATERKTLIERASAASTFCAGEQDEAARFGITTACLPAGKFKAWTPRVTVDWKPTRDTLLYGVYAEGVKPGGFNGTGGLTALALTGEDLVRYQQETAKGGEVGTKLALANNRINIGVALFYNKLSGVQLTRSLPPTVPGQTTTSVAVNSGNARTQGIELELFARPMRGLSMQAGYSLADAKFTKGCDFDYFVLNSGGLQPNFSTSNPTAAGLPLCNIDGKRLPLGSKHTLNGSVDYEARLTTALRLISNVQASWESKKYIQTDNLAYVPSAFLLNARLGIKTDRFTIAAFGRNLTDEDAPPLATRWFDYRYGNALRGAPATDLPAASAACGGLRCGTFDGSPARVDTGAPRGFFAPLRRGRSFGVEVTFNVR